MAVHLIAAPANHCETHLAPARGLFATVAGDGAVDGQEVVILAAFQTRCVPMADVAPLKQSKTDAGMHGVHLQQGYTCRQDHLTCWRALPCCATRWGKVCDHIGFPCC